MDKEPPNPIMHRLNRLESLWRQFMTRPEARICRWLISEDEMRMIYGFVEYSYTTESEVDESIINFQTAFTSKQSYSKDLVQDLWRLCQQDQPEMAENDLILSWKPREFSPYEKNAAAGFLSNFAEFGQQLKAQSIAVAFLDPNDKIKDFEKWLGDALQAGIPDTMRIMVIDLEQYSFFENLSKLFPEKITTLQPKLDMMGAMKQLASAGNPTDPAVQFRRAFLDLSQAVSKLDIDLVKKAMNSPLQIATENNWPHLQASVYALAASAYSGNKRYDEALQQYQQSQQIGITMLAKGDALGATIAMQALFHKGAMFVAKKDFQTGAKTYGEAAIMAQHTGDPSFIMEARRMQCFCSTHAGDGQNAWTVGWQGLDAAEKIDPAVRANSTLPFLGKSLLDLANRLGKKAEYPVLLEKMQALAGTDWEKRAAHIQNRN